MNAKGEVLLKTKPGCVIGVRERDGDGTHTGIVYVGSMSSYDGGDTVQLRDYVIFDTESFSLKGSRQTRPREFGCGDPSDIVLGQQLLERLGGDINADMVLDALGRGYSKKSHREYLRLVRQAEAEKERAEATAEKQRRLEAMREERSRTDDLKKRGLYVSPWSERWKNFKEGAGDMLCSAGYALKAYAWGTLPILDDYIQIEEGDRTKAFVGANAVNISLALASNLAAPSNHALVVATDTLAALPWISIVSGSTVVVGTGLYEERQREIRMEKFRQAVCPADASQTDGA